MKMAKAVPMHRCQSSIMNPAILIIAYTLAQSIISAANLNLNHHRKTQFMDAMRASTNTQQHLRKNKRRERKKRLLQAVLKKGIHVPPKEERPVAILSSSVIRWLADNYYNGDDVAGDDAVDVDDAAGDVRPLHLFS